MTTPSTRAIRARRKAPVKAKTFEYSHLDLENLVVALLTDAPAGYPNALRQLGYRLHNFDAQITLLEGGKRVKDLRPDAVARHDGRNLAIVLECKTGKDVGLHQLPEGRAERQDQWADALSLPRRGLLGNYEIRGVLVSSTAMLEPRASEIVDNTITWLRVDQKLQIDPDFLPDERVAPAIAALPAKSWPRTYVPFSYEASEPGGLDLAIAKIGPLILEAALNGREFVEAESLARRTHAAVWNVTDGNRHAGWTNTARRALESLANGRLRELATYDKVADRLWISGIVDGERPPGFRIRNLQRAIASSHRRVQRVRSRVRHAPPTELQITLFDEEDL